MQITNKTGLPEVLVDAVTNDPYSRGPDVFRSATELVGPPQIASLSRKHEDEITIDVSDRLYSLYGRLVHQLLENSVVRFGNKSRRNFVTEKRLYARVPLSCPCPDHYNGADVKISGSFDSYDLSTAIMSDYKFVSAWKFKDGVPKEYEQQLNIYAWLWQKNYVGVTSPAPEKARLVKGLTVTALYRDWSKSEAKRNPAYPQAMVEVHDVPLWSMDEQEAYIRERVAIHAEAEKSDDHAFWCTAEERWATPEKWAVYGKGKKALKLHNTLEEAEQDSRMVRTEFRPGKSVRCESYCDVAEFCRQYKQIRSN